MPDFIERRKLARMLDRCAERFEGIAPPKDGWISAMRQALGMSAEQVARRKGVTRNAVYQAERSEKDGAVSIRQMEQLAQAMGGRFVYAIVPDAPVDILKNRQARRLATHRATGDPTFALLSKDDQQDQIDDVAAELLHDMPSDFWDMTE